MLKFAWYFLMRPCLHIRYVQIIIFCKKFGVRENFCTPFRSKISNFFEILELIAELHETNRPKFWDFLKIDIWKNTNFNLLENWRAHANIQIWILAKVNFSKNKMINLWNFRGRAHMDRRTPKFVFQNVLRWIKTGLHVKMYVSLSRFI